MAQQVVRNATLLRLPLCYRQFYVEWKYGTPTPVHYVPEPGKWKRIPETGEMKVIQNIPLPLTIPEEFENCLLGGEGLVKGFQKRHQLKRRVPHYWFPTLQSHVVHSEILDKHMEVICTKRLLQLVDQHNGFDRYLLESSPQDLKTNLALKLKRKLLLALVQKDFLPDNPTKRDILYEKYKKYVLPLEEAEWYGLTVREAVGRLEKIEKVPPPPPIPLKLKFREEFIQQLKEQEEAKILGAAAPKSWGSFLNPFKSEKRP
nr:EOG090X0GHI [Sida crystallina]